MEEKEWVDEAWEFIDGWPKNKIEFTCGFCGSPNNIIRGYMYHCKPGSPYPYRVDVGMKCTCCAALWYHGVRCPVEHFKGHGNQFNRRGEALNFIPHEQQPIEEAVESTWAEEDM